MLIRGEGVSQPQRIVGEITLPRGRDIQNGWKDMLNLYE